MSGWTGTAGGNCCCDSTVGLDCETADFVEFIICLLDSGVRFRGLISISKLLVRTGGAAGGFALLGNVSR